jgi:hypothetical protein
MLPLHHAHLKLLLHNEKPPVPCRDGRQFGLQLLLAFPPVQGVPFLLHLAVAGLHGQAEQRQPNSRRRVGGLPRSHGRLLARRFLWI